LPAQTGDKRRPSVSVTDPASSIARSAIALGYRLKSQPAFPEAKGLRDADDVAGQLLAAAALIKETNHMFKLTVPSRKIWQALGIVSAIAISLATASAALAAECPAEKIKPNARYMVDYKPVGVTDVTLGSIDLGKQPAHIEGRELRFRKLTIEPGGIVPWHSHDDRPALIFVQQGEIIEYASNCVDPIVHKAGDLRPEVYGTSHWWKNLGKETAILYVGDVRKDPTDHNM
jgi:quercetin dioxygenase-like cupin family protein